MWLQNREKGCLKRWFRGGAEMPEVLIFLVFRPDRRRIELICLAETDVFRKQEIRTQCRFWTFRVDRLIGNLHLVKGMEIEFEDFGLVCLKRVADDDEAGLYMDDFAQGGVQSATIGGGGITGEAIEMVVMEESRDFSFGMPAALFALTIVEGDAAFGFCRTHPLVMVWGAIVVVMAGRDGERFAVSF